MKSCLEGGHLMEDDKCDTIVSLSIVADFNPFICDKKHGKNDQCQSQACMSAVQRPW